MPLRTWDAALFKYLVEPLAVLGSVDAVRTGPQDILPALHQMLGQLDCGLPAELHHNPPRFFGLKQVVDVLGG